MDNPSNYSTLKAQGVISLAVVGQMINVTQKQFDPNTGVALPDTVYQIDPVFIQGQITALQAQLASLSLLLTDCNALLVTPVI